MKSSRVLNTQMSSWTVRSSTLHRNATSMLKNSVHLNVSGNSFPLISMVCNDGKRKLCFSRSFGLESSNQLMIIQQLVILLKIGLGKASPRTFFWPGAHDDAVNWVRSCEACNQFDITRYVSRPLQPIATTGRFAPPQKHSTSFNILIYRTSN